MSDEFVLRVSVVNKDVLQQYEREAAEQPLPETPADIPAVSPSPSTTGGDEKKGQ